MNTSHVWNRALVGCFSLVIIASAGIPSARAETIIMDSIDYATLSGYVFCDMNNNGIWESEKKEGMIPGVLIILDGLIDLKSPEALALGSELGSLAVSKTTKTDSKGNYKFENVLPGAYSITEEKLEMFVEGQKINPLCAFGGWPADCNTFDGIVVFSGASGVWGGGYNFAEWGLKTRYLSKRDLIVVVPEPAAAALLAGALLLGICWIRRRR